MNVSTLNIVPRILIVDDEPAMMTLLNVFLKQSGDITSANNYDDAINAFQEEVFDLVITDIRMPGKNGIEILRSIKKMSPDIPVIVITGHGEKNEAIECLKLGAFDFILKPFEKEVIINSVTNAIRSYHLHLQNDFAARRIKHQSFTLNKQLEELENLELEIDETQQIAPEMAHEVTNPLTALIFKLEKIQTGINKEDIDKDKLNQDITKSLSLSRRINSILKSMLLFNRTKGEIDCYQICLTDTINEAVQIFKEQYGDKFPISIDVPQASSIWADEIKITQVIFNLIKNSYQAVQHSESPWIKVIATQNNNHMIISIIDSGKGIEKSISDKMFKTNVTTKERGEGNGLGLRICSKIIDSHKGKIYVDQSGHNTTIKIELPINKSGEGV